MSDSFGLKIGIEGEKAFKDALRDINQSFKVLGSEMTLVTSQFDKNDKSVNALASRNAVLNKEIDQQKEKITTLRAALDNAASFLGENDRVHKTGKSNSIRLKQSLTAWSANRKRRQRFLYLFILF